MRLGCVLVVRRGPGVIRSCRRSGRAAVRRELHGPAFHYIVRTVEPGTQTSAQEIGTCGAATGQDALSDFQQTAGQARRRGRDRWRTLAMMSRLMPRAAGRLWLAEADSLLSEIAPARRGAAIRSYLVSAPRLAVMMWAREVLRRARLGPRHPG